MNLYKLYLKIKSRHREQYQKGLAGISFWCCCCWENGSAIGSDKAKWLPSVHIIIGRNIERKKCLLPANFSCVCRLRRTKCIIKTDKYRCLWSITSFIQVKIELVMAFWLCLRRVCERQCGCTDICIQKHNYIMRWSMFCVAKE